MATSQGAPKILGKTIIGIIQKANFKGTLPASQVFLLFDDNTYYEFYARAEIIGASHVDHGGIKEVQSYCAEALEVVFETFSK